MNTSEFNGHTLRRGNNGRTKRSVGDSVTATITAGAVLAGAAFVADKMGSEPAEPTPYSGREHVKSQSGGRLAEQMDAPGWKLPADTGSIVVVYPQKLSRPTDRNAVFSASAHVAGVLGLKNAEDHDNVLELVRAYILTENQEKYGTVAERANFKGPVALFDVERESIIFNSRDLRDLLKKWDSGELRDSPHGEKENVFAAVMNDIVENLPPTGAPPGYKAIPSTNPRLQRILPGDFPRISPEQFERALDQSEFRAGRKIGVGIVNRERSVEVIFLSSVLNLVAPRLPWPGGSLF
jgi:hypothetical protein